MHRYMLAERQTHRQTGRQTDGATETDRQTDRQTDIFDVSMTSVQGSSLTLFPVRVVGQRVDCGNRVSPRSNFLPRR